MTAPPVPGGSVRVQNGYIRTGTGGHARPLPELMNRSVSGENVPARVREWTRVAHLSFSRNEGIPRLSPGVGFPKAPCSEAVLGVAEHFHS
jgi:hypothetical protein